MATDQDSERERGSRAEAAAAADRLLAGLGFRPGGAPVIFAPAGTRGRLPLHAWQALARAVRATSGVLPVILLPAERPLELIADLAGESLLLRVPEETVRTVLLRRARVLVTDDASRAAQGVALRRPVMSLLDDRSLDRTGLLTVAEFGDAERLARDIEALASGHR